MSGSNACSEDGKQKKVIAGAEGRRRPLNTTPGCEHNDKEFTSPVLGAVLN